MPAASSAHAEARSTGALAPRASARAPATAEPAAMPPTRPAVFQVNASVTAPGGARWPTSVYWHDIMAAHGRPASTLNGSARARDCAVTSGSALSPTSASSTPYRVSVGRDQLRAP